MWPGPVRRSGFSCCWLRCRSRQRDRTAEPIRRHMEVVGASGNLSTGIAPARIEQQQMTFNRVAADLQLTSYLTPTEALHFHLVAEHAYILHPQHHLPSRSSAGRHGRSDLNESRSARPRLKSCLARYQCQHMRQLKAAPSSN